MKTYKNIKLYQRLINPTTLPPFPDVARRTLMLLQKDNTSFKEVSDSIITDPSLVAMILKVVNSPLFSATKEITNINQALTFLGFKRLRSILLTYFMRTFVQGGAKRFPYQKQLWEHSLSVALYAQIIAIQLDVRNDDDYFTAGLLHDMGRFVLGIQDPSLYEEILTVSNKNGIDFYEAEQRRLGFNHQDIGYGVANSWSFPSAIREAIHLHHEIADFDSLPSITQVVIISNLMSHFEYIESSEKKQLLLNRSKKFLIKIGVDAITIEGIQVIFKDRIKRITLLF